MVAVAMRCVPRMSAAAVESVEVNVVESMVTDQDFMCDDTRGPMKPSVVMLPESV
jgi:hypothetical protein